VPKSYIREKNDFCDNRSWENWISKWRKLKHDHYLSHHRKKMNSKWIKDLDVRPELLKLLKGNISRYKHSNDFLSRTIIIKEIILV
jgi:hypothetical protein